MFLTSFIVCSLMVINSFTMLYTSKKPLKLQIKQNNNPIIVQEEPIEKPMKSLSINIRSLSDGRAAIVSVPYKDSFSYCSLQTATAKTLELNATEFDIYLAGTKLPKDCNYDPREFSGINCLHLVRKKA
jgi:hypothetical protein